MKIKTAKDMGKEYPNGKEYVKKIADDVISKTKGNTVAKDWAKY